MELLGCISKSSMPFFIQVGQVCNEKRKMPSARSQCIVFLTATRRARKEKIEQLKSGYFSFRMLYCFGEVKNGLDRGYATID